MTSAPKPRENPQPTLKEEARTSIQVLRDGERCKKTYTVPSILAWRTFLLPSRGAREYENLRAARESHLPCVAPIEWEETRRWGMVRSSALTWVFVRGRCLRQALRQESLSQRERFAVCRGLGDLLRRFHDAGHAWLTAVPRNVILPPEPDTAPLIACDLPYSLKFRQSIVGRSVARVDLFSMSFSPSRMREFSARERRFLLLSYCRGNRDECRRLLRVLNTRTPRRQRGSQAANRAWFGVVVPTLGRLMRAFRKLPREAHDRDPSPTHTS